MYYLFLLGVIVTALVVARLAPTRLGRAWRAIRADEDVAQALGIPLVSTKLLAFGVSSAFAGLGGAFVGAWFKGIFPDTFTVFVSINVLSLIIIGGMGSVLGILLGAFMLVGMPEVLREFKDYRLLAYSSLLVLAMLLRPQGLIPPRPAKLAAAAAARGQKSAAGSRGRTARGLGARRHGHLAGGNDPPRAALAAAGHVRTATILGEDRPPERRPITYWKSAPSPSVSVA